MSPICSHKAWHPMKTVMYDVNLAPWDYGQMAVYAGLIVVAALVPMLMRWVRRTSRRGRGPRSVWGFTVVGVLLAVISIAGIVQCISRAQSCLDARASGQATPFSGTISSVDLVRTGNSSRGWRQQRIAIGDRSYLSAFGRDMSECGFKQSLAMTTTLEVGMKVAGLASGNRIVLLVASE